MLYLPPAAYPDMYIASNHLKHKLMANDAMFFGRYGDTNCPERNIQAAGSPKCHLPVVRNLDTHPFENPQLTLINDLSERFTKQNFGHRTEGKVCSKNSYEKLHKMYVYI
jgi:hypothetical protein